MNGLQVRANVGAFLSWDYEARAPRVRALYEQGKQAQWDAARDVDWSVEVPFGAPLPDDSAFALSAFQASPLARYGRPMWDIFRWEFQTWMVSQILHGEQGALVATARLAEVLPDLDAKYFAAGQVGDEARHVEVFSRYLREHVPEPYGVSGPLSLLLEDVLGHPAWDVTTLGMQVIIEGLAIAAFRLVDSTFHDDLIRQITRRVAADEARHVSFGIISLQGVYTEMTDDERAIREEFVLEAAELFRRRFLLEDIWDRLGVDAKEGRSFAAGNEMMVTYRRAIFSRVTAALSRIGLMTRRVREGLARLDLLAPPSGAS